MLSLPWAFYVFFKVTVFSVLAIVVRFLTRRFLPEYQSGIETVYHYKDSSDDNDIQIIDTCGNVRNIPLYYIFYHSVCYITFQIHIIAIYFSLFYYFVLHFVSSGWFSSFPLFCNLLQTFSIHGTFCKLFHCIVSCWKYYIMMQYFVLHCTVLHCIALYCTVLYCITLSCIVLNCMSL